MIGGAHVNIFFKVLGAMGVARLVGRIGAHAVKRGGGADSLVADTENAARRVSWLKWPMIWLAAALFGAGAAIADE